MSHFIIFFNIVIILVSVYFSSSIFKQTQLLQKQSNDLHERINLSKVQLDRLISLKNNPIEDVEYYYKNFYEDWRIFNAFNGFKQSVELISKTQGEGVYLSLVPSLWEGINQLNMKLKVFDVVGQDQYMQILQALVNIEKRYPCRLSLIHQDGNDMEITMQLYGK